MNPEPSILEPARAAAPSAVEEPRRLSADLRALLHEADGHTVTVERIEEILKGRGVAMLILLLSAPFIVPAPGLSTPFGIGICLLGLRIAVGGRSALPRFIREKEVKFAALERVVNCIVAVVSKLEKRIRPRMRFMRDHPRMVNLIGVGIISSGFVLSLPLPIPLSNLFPALSIMCLAAGLMERDGLLVLWGYLLGFLSWVYLAIWWKVVAGTWDSFILWLAW